MASGFRRQRPLIIDRHQSLRPRPNLRIPTTQTKDMSDLMSQHSVENRQLVTLLRERGTIPAHETVPEDSLFHQEVDYPVAKSQDDQGLLTPSVKMIMKETRIGALPSPSYVTQSPVFGGSSGPSTSPISPTTLRLRPSKSSPKQPITVYGKHHSVISEKVVPKLPPAVSRFAGPFAGVPEQSRIPGDLAIQVSKKVEVTHDRPLEDEYWTRDLPAVPGQSHSSSPVHSKDQKQKGKESKHPLE